MTPLDRIRVVLVHPGDAANVGAAARALKNMGLSRLVLVTDRALDRSRAATLAVHADDVLDAAQTVSTLPEAVADCGLVVATSGRPSQAGISPRESAPDILGHATTNEVALVFGPADRGLSNDELALCQLVVKIPASADYPSLNLAQAVLVCSYELWLAAEALCPAGAADSARVLASNARREQLYAKLEGALHTVGFLHETNAAHMMRTLRQMLGRAALDDADIQVLLGVAHRIGWLGRSKHN